MLPPETFSKFPSGSTPQTFEYLTDWIEQLCYFYEYDVYGRMAIKKLPGADEIFLVYNRRNELVLTQDGESRKNNDWLYTKYDVYSRPIITGKYHHTSSVSQADMQTTAYIPTNRIFETYSNNIGYTNIAFPVTSGTDGIYTISYYDNYKALELEANPEDYTFISDDLPFYFLDNNGSSTKIKGLPTVTKTKVLLHDGLGVSNEWLVSVTYYDSYNRAIQTISNNHLGGRNIVSSLINFTGEVEETKEYVDINTNSNTIYQKFTYNHTGQLTETLHKLNNQDWVVLNNNKYNETGQLTRKQIHKTENSFLQTTNFGYNIRGWLTSINDITNPDDDLFSMKLDYNTSANSAQFNGNIGTIKWNSAMFSDIMQYDYNYDGANRLLSSSFTGNGDYSTNYSYYKNGNIKSLTRIGELGNGEFGIIDNLTYDYVGNQLNYVNDDQSQGPQEYGFTDNGSFLTTKEYFYDLNGNLKKDYNKQIVEEIGYNYMNLPQHIIVFNDENKYIDYLYNADGQKLQKVANRGDGVTTDYIGSFVFIDNETDFIFTPEGRVVPNDAGSLNYEYYLVDHLGNTRVSFSQTGEVLQDNSYYPFGMSLGSALSFQSNLAMDNNYLYNGKELQDDFDLDWYDYHARYYDPVLARWHVIDNLAEKYSFISPYSYVLNNPLIFIDPDGQDIEIVIGKPYTDSQGKEHPYGHMAIRVHGEGYNYVFDFGRYGRTWPIGAGEGILNVYKDGAKYLASEQRIRESIGYNISSTAEEDQKVIDYYLNLVEENGSKTSEKTKGLVPGGGGKAFELEDDYAVRSNNCVTKSAEGLKQVGENKIGNENDPRDVLKDFEANYKEMGFTKKTVYLEGGGTKVVYERKPLPKPRRKENENH